MSEKSGVSLYDRITLFFWLAQTIQGSHDIEKALENKSKHLPDVVVRHKKLCYNTNIESSNGADSNTKGRCTMNIVSGIKNVLLSHEYGEKVYTVLDKYKLQIAIFPALLFFLSHLGGSHVIQKYGMFNVIDDFFWFLGYVMTISFIRLRDYRYSDINVVMQKGRHYAEQMLLRKVIAGTGVFVLFYFDCSLQFPWIIHLSQIDWNIGTLFVGMFWILSIL